ncbi:hypothetical protein HZC07_04000 [Candidatus Micrarchaeota archaeon]|nr:hypothetical protein [Candidatus Micrarchaeota archaeon]
MASAKTFGFLVFFLFLATVASAATCAQKSYLSSCTKCTFDSTGKMNQACYQKYQDSGVACLFASYPIESVQYKLGSCPAIDVCVDRLNECKAVYSENSDKFDCEVNSIGPCFARADSCVARAVKNCSGTPSGDVSNVAPDPSLCDGFLLGIMALVGGISFVRMKKSHIE